MIEVFFSVDATEFLEELPEESECLVKLFLWGNDDVLAKLSLFLGGQEHPPLQSAPIDFGGKAGGPPPQFETPLTIDLRECRAICEAFLSGAR